MQVRICFVLLLYYNYDLFEQVSGPSVEMLGVTCSCTKRLHENISIRFFQQIDVYLFMIEKTLCSIAFNVIV
jgi:hypothetical protein